MTATATPSPSTIPARPFTNPPPSQPISPTTSTPPSLSSSPNHHHNRPAFSGPSSSLSQLPIDHIPQRPFLLSRGRDASRNSLPVRILWMWIHPQGRRLAPTGATTPNSSISNSPKLQCNISSTPKKKTIITTNNNSLRLFNLSNPSSPKSPSRGVW